MKHTTSNVLICTGAGCVASGALELSAAINDQNVRDRFAELGAHPAASTPEELRQYIVVETKKWGEIVSRGGVPTAQ